MKKMVRIFSSLFAASALRLFGAGFIVATMLSACATLPATSAHTSNINEPLTHLKVPAQSPDQDLLLKLMSAEFALSHGDVDSAGSGYLDAALISNDPAVAAQATQVALAGKHWDRANQALARWQVLSPNDAGILQARAALDLIAGHTDAAYASLLELVRLHPDGRPQQNNGWQAVGLTLLSAPDKKVAGDLLQRLATPEQLGKQGEIWIAISQLALKLDRSALSTQLADQAVTRFHSSEAYAWAAQLALRADDKKRAKTLYAESLQHDAKNPRLRIGYAKLLSDMGENAEAARLLARGPQDDLIYSARAAYAARASDKKLIVALYKEIEALPAPRPSERLTLLGQLAELLELKPEAQHWYGQVNEDDDHYFDAQTRIAILLDQQGKGAEALELVHTIQARAGDDRKALGEAFQLEAELLNHQDRRSQAVDAYTRGLKALPDDTRLLYGRALLSEEINQTANAEKDLRRVVELKPNDADALNALGYTLADRTEHKDEALGLIQKALSLKPDDPAIIDSLGWVQYRLGNLVDAVKSLRRAFERQPDAEIAAHFGEVLWISGSKDEARKVWAEGGKQDGKNKSLLETQRRLGA
jgi:tetratricopeptide (TPR) repeat protein